MAAATMAFEKFYTTAEVEERLGLPTGSLKKARHYKLGSSPPFVKIGSRVRYREADVLRWIEQQTVNPAASK